MEATGSPAEWSRAGDSVFQHGAGPSESPVFVRGAVVRTGGPLCAKTIVTRQRLTETPGSG